MLACAPRDRFGFGDFNLLRRQPGPFVRTVAEWLALRAAAGTPPICARFDLLNDGGFLCGDWFFHNADSASEFISQRGYPSTSTTLAVKESLSHPGRLAGRSWTVSTDKADRRDGVECARVAGACSGMFPVFKPLPAFLPIIGDFETDAIRIGEKNRVVIRGILRVKLRR